MTVAALSLSIVTAVRAYKDNSALVAKRRVETRAHLSVQHKVDNGTIGQSNSGAVISLGGGTREDDLRRLGL